MKKYEVVMHIFAHEMHDFQRLTEQLKRCLSFVDIDVEGMDEIVFQQVLQLEYKPLLVCIENKLANLNKAYPSTQIDRLALESGYSLICKTLLNSFYINCESDAFDWIPNSMTKL